MKYNILITGGLGYIGRVLARKCRDNHNVMILDNYSGTLRMDAMPGVDCYMQNVQTPCIQHDKRTEAVWRKADLIVHLAATASTTAKPDKLFANNVGATTSVLDSMVHYKKDRLVFASSAAVYGRIGDSHGRLNEHDANQGRIGAYGQSKYLSETMMTYYHHEHGINYTAMRFFNVAGAIEDEGECRPEESHLIPNLIKAAITGQPCMIHASHKIIRDYIHVADVCNAIGRAGEMLMGGHRMMLPLNICSGKPVDIDQVITAVEHVVGKKVNTIPADRRSKFDPDYLVGYTDKAEAEIGFKAGTDLYGIVASAYNWFKRAY